MKFSMECYIIKGKFEDSGLDDYEFEDISIIGELLNTADEIDFRYNDDMKTQIKDEMKKLNLPDGEYHGYFIGTWEYERSYSWEYGVEEFDLAVGIDEFYFLSFEGETSV